MHVTLRPAELNDLSTVLSWIPDADACRMWAGPHVRYPAGAPSVWETIKADGRNAYSLVDADNCIVGFGQILPRGAGVVHLARIIIDPGLRGHGYGRLLCMELMNAARDRLPVRQFTLHVYRQNPTAIALYRSLGFEPQAKRVADNVLFMSQVVL